jgi:hypothetical protein
MPAIAAAARRAVLGVLLAGAPALALADAETPRDAEVQSLSSAVERLEARLAEETKAREALEARLRAAEAEAPRQLAERPPSDPKALRPLQGVTVTLGGFLAAEAIYRSRNEASDISSSFSRIPFDNAPQSRAHELRGTARQSRLSLLVEGDAGPALRLSAYGEIDFQGAAQTANSIESNSYNPRLRHLYGVMAWKDRGLQVLAGQTWSLATLNAHGITPRNEAPPPVIDGQYLPGFVWARQPQLRVTKSWGEALWSAVSLENPQTSFASPATGISLTAPGVTATTGLAGVSGFDNGNSLSFNDAPDIVGKLAYEPRIGGGRPLHLEVFGLWRRYQTRVDVAAGNALGLPPRAFTARGSGGGVGGSATGSIARLRLDLQASVLSGRGIGRYGSAQLPDVVLAPDGGVAPIRQTMLLAGTVWHATPSLDLYAFAGEERQQPRFFNDSTGRYGLGNPSATFTPASCSTEGAACAPNIRRARQLAVGAWRQAYKGPYGQVRLGLEYSHTQLVGFAADGFEPRTAEDMVFASFRLYPPSR